MSVQQHGRTVKSIRGKLYFYRGTVLLMVIERIVNMLYFSYGVGSPCRTVCTVCSSPPCMKNKSY